MTDQVLTIGPDHPMQWWMDHWPRGCCRSRAGQCDGDECGLHAAGCIFGGPDFGAYWLIADGCTLWHGESP